MEIVFAVNPILETGGRIAAIIICLYAVIFVVLALAFNAGMAIGADWLRQKINIIKMLRPTVDSVNKTTEMAMEGQPIDANQNRLIRTVAEGPVALQNVDKKVDQASDKVANAVIKLRSRTAQVSGIVRTFFKPLPSRQQVHVSEVTASEDGVLTSPPGYQGLQAPRATPTSVPAEERPLEGPALANGYARDVEAAQFRDVPTR